MSAHLDDEYFKDTAVSCAIINQRQQQISAIHQFSMMKVLIAVGIVSILALLVLETIYFRRAIFVLIIPTAVIVCTVIGIMRQNKRLIWPMIGISFFHMFLAAYALLIFSFFFFFKPLYIIMVLNWAFDTLYTTKTLSYYLYSLAIYCILIGFFFFNLWQSHVSVNFHGVLKSHNAEKLSTFDEVVSAAPSATASDAQLQSKILNEPPIAFPQHGLNVPSSISSSQYLPRQQISMSNGDQASLYSKSNIGMAQPPNTFSLSGRGTINSMTSERYNSRRTSLTEGRRFAI